MGLGLTEVEPAAKRPIYVRAPIQVETRHDFEFTR